MEAVAAALINEPGDARIVVDLVLNWRPEHSPRPLKIVRLDSREMNAGQLIGRQVLAPKDAAGELVRFVASAGDAVVLPAALGRPRGPMPRYDSIDQYQEATLRQDIDD